MSDVVLFDTTLRDGAQTSGVDFSPADKSKLAKLLDDFGIPYVEAGWPGANDTDNEFFKNPPQFKNAKLTAFGMTRRVGRSASNDEGLSKVLDSPASVVCLVGKTWDKHVFEALGTTLDENLKSIHDSVARAKSMKSEVVFDLEHFFDGFKANKDYALACMKTALEAGADWLVMCDTNGGTFPDEVRQIVSQVKDAGFKGEQLGIHTHDDMSCAIANTIEAVQQGVKMVQGTLNGLGERSGNANLVTLIPMFAKLDLDCGVDAEKMKGLKKLSLALDDILDRVPDERAPFVGRRAFVHKGGLHGSAVAKNPALYEHVEPASVGNTRLLPMSDQGGLANLEARLQEFGIEYSRDDKRLRNIIDTIKELEAQGYAYDQADASFELLVRKMLGTLPHYFYIEDVDAGSKLRPVINEDLKQTFRRKSANTPQATVKVIIGNKRFISTAEGTGPVNAIDVAFREAMIPHYPVIENMRLSDFKVRIPSTNAATAAVTVVRIESTAQIKGVETKWMTIGVSPDIIDASTDALIAAYDWFLLKTNTPAIKPDQKLIRSFTGTQPR